MEYRFGNFVLNDAQLTLTRDGHDVAVEPKVFDLIHHLARNPGQLLSKDQLIEAVWEGRIISDSALSACIAAARKALGDDGKAQAYIRTVSKRGIMFVAEVAAPKAKVQAETPPSPTSQRIRYARRSGIPDVIYAVDGEGPPLVRLDAPGWDIEAEWSSPHWRKATQDVAQYFRLARQASKPVFFGDDPTNGVDWDRSAEQIGAVADAAGFDRFALYSLSGGVHSTLRFAVKYPERIEKLVIMGGYVKGRSIRHGTAPEFDAFRHMTIDGWDAELDGMKAAIMFPYFPEGPIDAIIDAARNLRGSSSKAEELAIRDAVNTADNSNLLANVKCPTLVVHARHDAVHPLSEARAFAAGIPDAELLILETANHVPVPGSAAWDVFLSAMRDFLSPSS